MSKYVSCKLCNLYDRLFATVRFCIILILFIGHTIGFSQGVTLLDSLKSDLQHRMVRQQFDSIDILAQRVMDVADDVGQPYTVLIARKILGDYYAQIGKLDTSTMIYVEVLDQIPEDSLAELAGLYQRIGSNLTKLGKFDEAFIQLDKGIRYCLDKKDMQKPLARLYGQIAYLYLRMQDYDKSIAYRKKSIDLMTPKDERSLYIAYYHIGSAYRVTNRPDSALAAFDKCRSYADIYEIPHYKNSLDIATMQVYMENKDYNKAGPLAEELFEIMKTRKRYNPEIYMAVASSLGQYYYNNNRPKEALEVLLPVSDYIDSTYRSPKAELSIKEHISNSYQKLGNYRMAYEYLDDVESLKDTLYEDRRIELVQEYESKFELDQKDKEIITQQLAAQRSAGQRNMAIMGLGALLMISLFFFDRYRKNQKLNSVKIDNLQKQQKLMALDYMVQGQEEERKRIAQELHDGLGGLLSSARLQMKTIEKEITKLEELQLFSKAEEMIDTACQEVRRISHDMMPGALIDLGLVEALEDLVSNAASGQMALISFETDAEDYPFSDQEKVQLYRIAQEAIQNAIKHAGAATINVRLEHISECLSLTIADDGRGFDSLASYSGLGLRTIQSRAEYLGGKMTVNSNESGTTLEVLIPAI